MFNVAVQRGNAARCTLMSSLLMYTVFHKTVGCFCVMAASELFSSLPDYLVSACPIGVSEKRLDYYWREQEFSLAQLVSQYILELTLFSFTWKFVSRFRVRGLPCSLNNAVVVIVSCGICTI